MKKLGMLVVLAGISLAGCNKGGSTAGRGTGAGSADKSRPDVVVPAGQESILFPMTVGDQWVYAYQVEIQNANGQKGQGAGEVTMKVTDVADVPDGGKQITLVLSKKDDDKTTADTQVWQVDKAGIHQVSTGTTDKHREFVPPQTVVPFPIVKNKVVEWKGTGPIGSDMGDSTSTATVTDTSALVELADGTTVKALQSEQVQKWTTKAGDEGRSETTSWWVPKVGLVRIWQSVTVGNEVTGYVLKLKSKSLKDS